MYRKIIIWLNYRRNQFRPRIKVPQLQQVIRQVNKSQNWHRLLINKVQLIRKQFHRYIRIISLRKLHNQYKMQLSMLKKQLSIYRILLNWQIKKLKLHQRRLHSHKKLLLLLLLHQEIKTSLKSKPILLLDQKHLLKPNELEIIKLKLKWKMIWKTKSLIKKLIKAISN
jgi:hypothetical protein